MKALIVFILCLQSLAVVAQGENTLLQPNNQCEGATRLCSSTFQDSVYVDSIINVPSLGELDLLYFYKFQAGTGTSATNYLTIHGTPNKTKYWLYGPFSNESDVCNSGNIVEMAPPTALGAHALNNDLNPGKWYLLVVKAFYHPYASHLTITAKENTMVCADTSSIPCEDCLQAFQPKNGSFVLSAWVKESYMGASAATTYSNTKIIVTGGAGAEEFHPSGQIIDGWQRIEGVFTASSTGAISVELVCTDGEAYFDDIRIFPFDGSMISYVYDPITRRLMAELDERNYAKLYEYDEEGKLVRVKKETEKGIMTIQENRENNSKQ